MFRDADEQEARARECERLAHLTRDAVLREQIISLSRVYRAYAAHLRGEEESETWLEVVNQ